MDDIMVSVICMAYNHENYIRDALEGFVKQKTNFPFEVLVHDDASTDSTADIIREYQRKYPHIIKPIFQTENQYSKGVKTFNMYVRPRITGRYVALCEGDDYWTDEFKLQKQFDILEAHPEVDGCTHKVEKRCATNGKVMGYIAPLSKTGVIPTEDVIRGGGEYLGTNSLMYRKEILEMNYKFRKALSLDYVTQISISLRGGVFYSSDCMSVYRVGAVGSWTNRMRKNPHMLNTVSEEIISMLECLDEETDYMYHNIIEKTILERECNIAVRNGDFIALLSKPLKECFFSFPLQKKVILLLRVVKNVGRNNEK